MDAAFRLGMSAAQSKFLNLIKRVEGDQLDLTAKDPGNWTSGKVGRGSLRGSKCGISAAAFPTVDIASLTDETIWFLYRAKYLRPVCFDDLPIQIGLIVADCAVNQGVFTAASILQASLDVRVDGVVGPITVAAAQRSGNAFQSVVGEIAARRALRYAETANLEVFGLGWMRRLITTYNAAMSA